MITINLLSLAAIMRWQRLHIQDEQLKGILSTSLDVKTKRGKGVILDENYKDG